MKKTPSLKFAFCLLLLSLAFSLHAAGFPRSVKDDLGRSVRLNARPRRVISLAPSVTEIACALRAGRQLVAVDAASDYPPAARKLPRIGDFLRPNIEKIISLQPDLIIMSSATIDPRSLNDLTSVLPPIPVFVQRPSTLKDVLRSVKQVGQLLGAESQAARLLASMNRTMASVRKKVSGRPRPKVFMEIWGDPLMTAGKNTVVDDLITLAGGTSIAKNLKKPFPTYSLESLIAAAPEVYLFAHSGSTVAKIKQRSGYRTIPAVRNGKIFALNPDILVRPTPRLMEGLKLLARTIHPEAYK